MSHASAVESLLFAALAKPTTAERAACLDAACAGDAELRRQAEKPLKAHANAGDFLQKPVVELLAAAPEPAHDPLRTTDHATPPEPEGPRENGEASPSNTVGPTLTFQPKPGDATDGSSAPPSEPPSIPGYEVEGLLGRGGMGVVYKARHLALKRTVALKMILAGGHAEAGDLAAYTRLAGNGNDKTRQAIGQLLARWQGDADLAALRGEKSLAALPAEQRQQRQPTLSLFSTLGNEI